MLFLKWIIKKAYKGNKNKCIKNNNNKNRKNRNKNNLKISILLL